MQSIQIHGKTIIGESEPAYIIAEMSANHAGSIERAKEIIYAAKEAGADCIKIQTYTPDTITIDCDNEYFHIGGGTWAGENLYSLYEKAYTPWEWQPKLKELADKIGIDFLSTPFDKTSVDFLEDMGMEFYKIASFELIDIPLIEYVASKGKPLIISTGMGTFEEIREAVEAVRGQGNPALTLLRCASAYPAISDEMNLKTMRNMSEMFDVFVGLSDHSMGSLGAVTAVALGAKVIEKHFCLSREIENPDSSFSMEPKEFERMVADIRQAEKAIGTVKYGPAAQEQSNIHFRKSIFAVKDIAKGEPITPDNIRVIRPGDGMKPKYYKEILGLCAGEDIPYGTPLKTDMLSSVSEIYLRKAERGDKTVLFEWANDSEVRANSFSTEPISWEEHSAWFERKFNGSDSQIYIMCDKVEPIGMLRFDWDTDERAKINYSIARDRRNRGYGYKIISLGEDMIKKHYGNVCELFAEVKEENTASNIIFLKLGYTKSGNVYVKKIRD